MIRKLLFLTLFPALLIACSEQPQDYCVTSFGAIPDGTTVSTPAIQEAIDLCFQEGGGKVLIPPGEFVTGTIVLKSNVNLHIEQGARLIGSKDTADYWIDGKKHGMILALQSRGVSISGEGEINGSGSNFHLPDRSHIGNDFIREATRQGEKYLLPDPHPSDGPWGYDNRPGMMIVFMQCEDVSIRDVSIHDSPEWTIRIADCDDVIVSGISILNNLFVPNSDGIHCTTSSNVRISDCDIRAGDDAIIVTGFSTNMYLPGETFPEEEYHLRKIGNKSGYAENVVVSNCILQSRSAGIRVGYGSRSIRNCTFTNLVIYDSNRGIGVFSRDPGSIENVIFSDIIIRNRLHSGHWWGNGEPIHVSAINRNILPKAGPIKNIRFRNIIAESENGILIYGTEGSIISDLRLDDVQVKISRGKHSRDYGGNFDLRPVYPKELGIFKHDIPALYSQFTDGLTINNFKVEWGDNLPSYMAQAIFCRDYSRLTINNLQGRAAHKGMKAVELDNWENADLENINR